MAFSSDIWVEGLERTKMPDVSDEFDEFGALHPAANFMPWGNLEEIPAWVGEPDHASYREYIESHIIPGQANCILIEEVNFSGKDASGAVNNTVDPVDWANFQTMLDVVKEFEGGVPMTLGEYAMARAYDNAPDIPNADQADENHNGLGDVAEPPVAEADTYSVEEDGALVEPAPGVLGNDTNPVPGTLSATVVTPPEHGTLDLAADGSFTYTPAHNFFGSDSFTYTASRDGVVSAPALATITVNAVNDPPTISARPAHQTVQYSDEVAKITVEWDDIDATSVSVSDDGLPADVAVREAMSNARFPVGTGGRYGIWGPALVPAGEYPTT